MATTDSHAIHTAHSSATDAEPQTPMWLPAVGVFLFLAGGVYAVTTRVPDAEELEAAASASAAARPPAKNALILPTKRTGQLPTTPTEIPTIRVQNGQPVPSGAAAPRRLPAH